MLLFQTKYLKPSITMENGLVVGHGRLHRKIQELNYDTTKFLDVDDECEPDYNLSIINRYIPEKIKASLCSASMDQKSFKFIINAFSVSIQAVAWSNVYRL